MKLNIKDYKIIKTKEYFKTSNFFFFVHGISRNSLDWLVIEQELKTAGLSYYKLLNKTTLKALNNSIYSNTKPVISGSTFLVKPLSNNRILKQTISNTFNPLFFELLIVKFNDRMYSVTSLQNTYSIKYKETKLLFYQFNLTHLKIGSKISK